MDELSLSAWLVMLMGYVICFGGAFWCLLIMWGKEPERFLKMIWGPIVSMMPWLVDLKHSVTDLTYRPFEFMEEGSSQKGIVICIVFLLLSIGWALGAFEEAGSEGGYTNVEYDVELYEGALDPITGYSTENSNTIENVEVEEMAITNITFTLTWEDEADEPGMENEGDEFQLNVTTPWGDADETPMTANQHGQEGVLVLTFSAPMAGTYPDSGSAGTYNATITMGEAGEQWLGGIPSIGMTDSGNEWTLTIDYQYYRKPLE